MRIVDMLPKIFSKLKSRFISSLRDPIVFIYIAVSIYVLIFTYMSFLQYFSFVYVADFCIYEHVIWRMSSESSLFGLSYTDGSLVNSIFHYNPIFIFLAIPYYFIPTPLFLLFIKSFLIGIGAIPIYKLANYKLKSVIGGFIFSLCYLLNPAVHGVELYEFHPVFIAMPLLIWDFYFIEKNDYKKGIIFSILSLLVQENVSITIFLLGTYFLFRKKKKIFCLTLMSLSILWLIFSSFIMMPILYKGTSLVFVYRFNGLGNTLLDVINTVLTNPIYSLTRSFFRERIEFLIKMFLPLSFFSLFSPVLLISSFEYGMHILFDNIPRFGIHHGALMTPFTFIAAIYGVKRISYFIRKKISFEVLHMFLLLLLIISIYSNISFSPFWIAYQTLNFGLYDHYTDVKSIVASLPKNSSIIVQDNLCIFASHFSDVKLLQWYISDIVHNITQKRFDFIILDKGVSRMPEEDVKILNEIILNDFIKIYSKDGIEIYKLKQNDNLGNLGWA
ncbi:MAG: DUF2079 domain-containing protein [Candidatus Aenigmatarchaeota archaeon]